MINVLTIYRQIYKNACAKIFSSSLALYSNRERIKMSEILEKGREEVPFRRFVVYFLDQDDVQNVNAEEFETIDFVKILENLEIGRSVFISRRKSHRSAFAAPVSRYIEFDHRETNI